MYRLLIKCITSLICIVYAINFIDNNTIALVLLSALALSFLIEIKNNMLGLVMYHLFFVLSIFYPPLIFTYPLVVQSSVYLPKIKRYFFLAPILAMLIVKDVNLMILLLSLVVYLAAYFEQQFSEYKEKVYQKDDDITIKAKEHQLSELRILNEKSKDVEIAILSERNRISREIHDSVGHTISGAIIQTEAMRTEDNPSLNAMIDALQANLKSGMADIRSSLHALHDKSIDLELAIHEIIEANSTIKIDCNYKIKSDFNYQLKHHIISVIKEAFANTLKHSDASYIKLSLIEMPKHLSITVEDNGNTNSEEVKAVKQGLGFISFQEFAKTYGGRFSVDYNGGLKLMFLLDKERICG